MLIYNIAKFFPYILMFNLKYLKLTTKRDAIASNPACPPRTEYRSTIHNCLPKLFTIVNISCPNLVSSIPVDKYSIYFHC